MEAAALPPRLTRVRAAAASLRAPAIGTRAALVAIMALAVGVRAWGLTRQGFWYDEAMTAWLVRESPGHLFAALPHTESSPPLYYALAWIWVRLFGDTEAGLRSLSLVAGVAAVPVAFAAARALTTRRAALLAALLVAVNPLLVWYSQEARAYSLLVLAAGASFWLFARARSDPAPARLLAWALVSAAALATHYFAVFVVAPEAVALLVRRRPALRWRVLATALLVAAAAALAVLAWTQRSHAHWQSVFSLGLRAQQIPQQLLAGFVPPATPLARVLIAAAAVACVALVALRGSGRERRAAALALGVALGAVAIPLLLALAGADYVNTRNVIGAAVPLAVGLGVCAGARRAGAAGLAAVAVIAAVSVALVASAGNATEAQRPHWRAVAALLAPSRGAQRAILVRGSSGWALPLAHYLPDTWWAGGGGVRASEIDVLRKLPVHDSCWTASWWGASCALDAWPPLRRPPASGFHFAGERRVAGFAVTRYVAARPVRIYQRRPPLDVPPQRAAAAQRKVLFTPVRAPLVP